MEKNYTHDCDVCEFVGIYKEAFHGTPGPFDLYVCGPNKIEHSYIARYGNEGDEYMSLSQSAVLGIAKEHPEEELGPLHTAYIFSISADILGREKSYGPEDYEDFWPLDDEGNDIT
jgi:hypothetical protein